MTIRDPLVSICVPIFNRRPFIEACLDSATIEAGVRRELVIVDDGSTDGTDQVVRSWMERRPDVAVRFEKRSHRGIAPTCNRLVEMAGGDFLAWLGSDDLLVDGGLSARIRYLEEHPGKLAVFGDARVIDSAGEILFDSAFADYRGVDKRRFLEDESLRRTLLWRWCVPQPVLLVRREIYGSIGGYDESFAVEDYDFYLRMLGANALGFVDIPVACYRVHEDNFCRHPRTRMGMMRQFFRAARKNRRIFRPAEQVAILGYGAGAFLKALALESVSRRGGARG